MRQEINDTREHIEDITVHALLGYQQQLAIHLDRAKFIVESMLRLAGKPEKHTAPRQNSRPAKKHHRMSEAGRAAVAAAQRKRWAHAKKISGPAKTLPAGKRKVAKPPAGANL